MLEKQIERYLCNRVKQLGGKALKFEPPGSGGWPDRIIFLPGGKTLFVEVKAPGQKPRPLQVKRAKELQKLGFFVECLDSHIAVKEFVEVLETLRRVVGDVIFYE